MDVGVVSSENVLASYERQLADAHRKIAMLEAALERERNSAAQAKITAHDPAAQEGPKE